MASVFKHSSNPKRKRMYDEGKKSNKDGDDMSRKEKTSFQENLFGDDKPETSSKNLKRRKMVYDTSSSEDEGQRKSEDCVTTDISYISTMAASAANAKQDKALNRDIGWEYGKLVDPTNLNQIRCNLCGKKMYSGVYRLKHHIAGTSKDVTACEKASKEDRLRVRDALKMKKKAKIVKATRKSKAWMQTDALKVKMKKKLELKQPQKEMDLSPKSATKSGKKIKYDESLIGAKVKVWWPADKMYYKGVVAEYYPARKKHKISYEDGEEEILHLKTQKWKMLRVDKVLYAHECQLRRGEIQESAKTPAISYITTKRLLDTEKLLCENMLLTDVDIKVEEPQTKSCSEVVGEVKTESSNEAGGVQTNGEVQSATVVYTSDEIINQDEGEDEDDGERDDEYESQDEDDDYEIQDEDEDEDDGDGERAEEYESQDEDEGEDEKENQPQIANLLNVDGDVEILDPKQEECELVENVSPVLDSVERLPSSESDRVYVQGYKVKKSNATVLEAIFKKHGDIAANCVIKTPSMRTPFIELACEIVKRIQTNNMVKIGKDIECHLLDVESVKINVSWIRAHFEALHKRKETCENHSLLMKIKENTGLVHRDAEKDLIKRSLELVAARERFNEAKTFARVLHLVGKNLNENILKSKSEIDSWVKPSII